MSMTRRQAIQNLAGLGSLAAGLAAAGDAAEAAPWSVATFQWDATPPVGHPLLGTSFAPAKSVLDPLEGRGLVFTGPDQPLVLACLDWCELRNDAHARWRAALAEAAGTIPERVLVHTVHQHDAPYYDLTAESLLRASPPGGSLLDAEYHESCVQQAVAALRTSLTQPQAITHIGTGQGRVRELASSRRVDEEGKVSFRRYSRCGDAALRALPEGEIDPWVRTITFFSEAVPVAALSVYACHPMSYYGGGEISGDFPNLARRQRTAAVPGVFQIYGSGCCGDVTAGKYNDGSRANRTLFADRLAAGMQEAWNQTTRRPLTAIRFRSVRVRLPHSELDSLSRAALDQRLNSDGPLAARVQAALGLSSLQRNPDGHDVDLPRMDFGSAQLVLLPAESFVAYQLYAQQVRPDQFVVTLGFGESAPGYIPTDQAFREGFRDEHGYTWVRPGTEALLKEALKRLLQEEI